jgi:hypothetical protein
VLLGSYSAQLAFGVFEVETGAKQDTSIVTLAGY